MESNCQVGKAWPYLDTLRVYAVPLLEQRASRTSLPQTPPKLLGLQSPKAQVTGQHALKPGSVAVAFLASDPTRNWQPYRSLSKWVRAACPNMVYVASEVQRGPQSIGFLLCSGLYKEKPTYLLRRESLTLPGSLDP